MTNLRTDSSIYARRNASQSSNGLIRDACGRALRFAPFAHAAAPDLGQPGTLAAYAAIASRALGSEKSEASQSQFMLKRGAWLVASIVACAGAAIITLFESVVAAPSTGRLASIVGLSPFLLGITTYIWMRWFFVFRQRAQAATVPLLELGLCAACGHPMRGSTELVDRQPIGAQKVGTSAMPNEFAQATLCACSECGARWPLGAASAPYTPDGDPLTIAFPMVEGPARWRSRRALARALRAEPEDFIRDASASLRYIAVGVGRRAGARSPVLDLLIDASFGALCGFAALCFAVMPTFCVLGACSNIFRGILPASTAFQSASIVAEASLAVSFGILCAAALRRSFRSTEVASRVKAALRARECPVCSAALARMADAPAIQYCTCCGSTWRS